MVALLVVLLLMTVLLSLLLHFWVRWASCSQEKVLPRYSGDGQMISKGPYNDMTLLGLVHVQGLLHEPPRGPAAPGKPLLRWQRLLSDPQYAPATPEHVCQGALYAPAVLAD